MKIYQVYAQCCIAARPIKEIDFDEAKNKILETVDALINNGDIDVPVVYDDDYTIDYAVYEKIMQNALDWFEATGSFWCGDYAIIRTEEYPTRSGSYGFSTLFLD